MIPRIKKLEALDDYVLYVVFDDGKIVEYDVKEDMDMIDSYKALREVNGLFKQVNLDESRTCIYWSDEIDLPSDMIYEYGKEVNYVR